MEKYNKQDIIATEELYFAIRPYIKNHPNMGLYMESDIDLCYKCGTPVDNWLEGHYYYTTVNRYPVYKCNNCKSHGRSRHAADKKEQRAHITSPIAR
jgi:hypothetical protein